MPAVSTRPFLRLAVIGALVAALGLAACGRKGPLDAPPGASLQGEAQPQEQRSGLSSSPVGAAPLGGQSAGPAGDTDEVKGPKRRIPLDVLLN